MKSFIFILAVAVIASDAQAQTYQASHNRYQSSGAATGASHNNYHASGANYGPSHNHYSGSNSQIGGSHNNYNGAPPQSVAEKAASASEGSMKVSAPY